jgi:hypothetical protein
MERAMNLTEPKDGGVVKQNGRGSAIRSLPVSKQFSTRSCVRCEGLLVSEWSYDLQNPGNHNVESLRCVQCGNRIDPIILQNQLRLSGALQSNRQIRHMNSMRIAPLRDVA